MPAIIDSVNITGGVKPATDNSNVFRHYANYVNDVFVRFMIMGLKYILTILLVDYSTFRIYMMFLLIKCIIVAEILS